MRAFFFLSPVEQPSHSCLRQRSYHIAENWVHFPILNWPRWLINSGLLSILGFPEQLSWACTATEQVLVYSAPRWIWQPAALLAWQRCLCDNCHGQEVQMLAWLCRLTCLRLVAKFRKKIFGGEQKKRRINYPIDCLHGGHSRASLQPRSAFSTGTAKVLIQNIWTPVCHLLLKSLRRQIKITKPPLRHIWCGCDPFVVVYCLRD